MSIERISPKHYPRVGFARRAGAWMIDFLITWSVSSILGHGSVGIQWGQILLFFLVWAILRILVVYNNQGQSLGRWAFDIKLLTVNRGRVPDLQTLCQREAIIGVGALLVAIALNNLPRNPTIILFILPLAIDCGVAVSDKQLRQALHDRFAGTMIVSSQRGYSLDIKLKQLVETVRRNVRR